MNPNQSRTPSKRIPTAQEQEEKQRRERLQHIAFEQRFHFDLKGTLRAREYLQFRDNEVNDRIEAAVQAQLLAFEQNETDELDDDYRQHLADIAFFEQEEETNEKQHDHAVQAQLKQREQLEQKQQLAESKQILHYEWIQDSDLFNKQVSKQMASSENRNHIIHSNDDDNDEQEQEKVFISFLSRFQQQQRKEEAPDDDDDTFVLARTSDEKLYFPTLQSRINETTVVGRPLKQSNVLCIFSEEQWNRKVNNYLEQTGNFLFVGAMPSDTSPANVEHILTKMSNLVVQTLHRLLFRRAITNEQYSTMMYYNQSLQFKVNRLDFIPIMYDNKIKIQPIIKCSTIEPMKGIHDLVNSLLQPKVNRIFHRKTFPTANEAIEALMRYDSEGSIEPGTCFVTIHVHGLRTTLSHRFIIDGLLHFFRFCKIREKIDGVSQTTIVQLIELILDNQYCIYENKLYRQTMGSSIDSPLITTLIDIYLFYWQYDLLRRLNLKHNRFFGRCSNKLIFTWDESKESLITFLHQSNLSHSNHPRVRMNASISCKVQYLDAEISHLNGILQTRVYHHATFEPYSLPYVSETRSTQSHGSILRAALLRAILYCSNVREFENERLHIELSFLLNDVSLYSIQKIVDNFFIEYRVVKRHMGLDESTYQFLRMVIRDNYQQQSDYHSRRRPRRWLH